MYNSIIIVGMEKKTGIYTLTKSPLSYATFVVFCLFLFIFAEHYEGRT